MSERESPLQSRWRPRSIGIIVAVAGVLASLVPIVLLLGGVSSVPVVLVWAGVYGYVPGAKERWPWWVLGQWLSLTAVQAGYLALVGGDWAPFWAAPFGAAITTVIWMGIVGLFAAHTYSWQTLRPVAPTSPIPAAAPVGETTTPRP